MSSLPNPSYPSATPILGKRHRHRRSAAISGDFDALGLGLFSPPPTSGSLSSSHKQKIEVCELDKHFNFNNEDDFNNKENNVEFSFPLKTPDLSKETPSHNYSSPPIRASPSYSLNSPIKLSHKKSVSTSSSPKTRFFLTEETRYGSENIPDAVIDLDDILNASLHIGNYNHNYKPNNGSSNSTSFHKRTESAPADISSYDDFLASPFLKSNSGPFISSPLSVPTNTLFQRSIHEQASDAIEEDDEESENIDIITSDDEFTNPQSALNGLYSNSSANSSCSSLRSGNNRIPSNHFIEKTFSNSSKDSNNSGNNTILINNSTTPTSKRSGAKANRYQTFYDQSFKISNALKISSSESINIVRSNSNGNNINSIKDVRLLGHSSSLPSLKSTSKRNIQMHPSRFGELRFMHPEQRKLSSSAIKNQDNQSSHKNPKKANNARIANNIQSSSLIDVIISNLDALSSASHGQFNQCSVTGIECYNSSTQPTSSTEVPVDSSDLTITPADLSQPQSLSQQQANPSKQDESEPISVLEANKTVSNSPISVSSDIASTIISNNGTIPSTDHSSLTSQNELIKSELKNDNDDHLSSGKSKNATPLIIISNSENDECSTPSTTSTFKHDNFSEEQTHFKKFHKSDSSTPKIGNESPVTSSKSSLTSSPKRISPKRQLSHLEEQVLKSTQIPSFKAPSLPPKGTTITSSSKKGSTAFWMTHSAKLSIDPSKAHPRHTKSKSFSMIMHDLAPRLSRTSLAEDTISMKSSSKKKHNRFIQWFKGK